MLKKETIRPIYYELQGYLSQIPVGEDRFFDKVASELCIQLADAIDELNDKTEHNFDRYKVTTRPVNWNGRPRSILDIQIYRTKLSGLISRIHGMYFADELSPQSSATSPTTIIKPMEKIELKNRKGQKIVGVLEKPEGQIKGTCVVQHGWGGHKDKPTVQTMKDSFLEKGFQTFNFDTTNSFGESDGDYEKSTLGLHWEDLEDVVNWAREQEWFQGPLALTGHSKGGYAVVRYAEEYPERVDFLVPVAPVVSGKLSFEIHEKNKPEQLKQWKEQGYIDRVSKEGFTKRQHWFQMEERLNHDLLPDASKVVTPVLIIVGSEDASCPPEHQEILLQALPEGNKELFVIEGAPHSYYEKDEQDSCKQAIQNWLDKVM